eukprot:TRINITY_DN1721_c0_g1_i2.p1 TRINITY_DN1721_c0_g1~~TRINITY_DN1721_c0_g1_i2.p1  ORF type:complete len:582 (+),score=193.28 TRINITY_DN1721_c0_g1_i2:105-1850(+)
MDDTEQVAKAQWKEDFAIPSDDKDAESSIELNSKSWPLLLKNYSKLNVRSGHYTPIRAGATPLRRSLDEHMKYGMIVLDKPANPSSHEVVSWIKRIFDAHVPMKASAVASDKDKGHKTGHSGTLDPGVTGCLIICVNRTTRLAKSQQNAGKQYVGIVKFHQPVTDIDALKDCIEREFTGPLLQKPPIMAAVKRQLRIRTIERCRVIEYNAAENVCIFRVDCEAGTYVRTLCEHYGLYLGLGARMAELRRTRSGFVGEMDGLSTLHDVLDSSVEYSRESNEAYLRRVVLPLETLLRGYPRIVVKDSCVAALCYGAKCMLPGVLRYEDGIASGDVIVMMTTKGEAVALGIASLSSSEMASCDHGIAAKLKRVIMDKDLYPRRWGLGPVARARAALISEGKLGKHGRTTDQTPELWWRAYVDYSGNPTNTDARSAHERLCSSRKKAPMASQTELAKFAPALAAAAAAGDVDGERPSKRARIEEVRPSKEEKKDKKEKKEKDEKKEDKKEKKEKKEKAESKEKKGKKEKEEKKDKKEKKEKDEKKEDKKEKKEKKEKAESKEKKGKKEKEEKKDKKEKKEKKEKR